MTVPGTDSPATEAAAPTRPPVAPGRPTGIGPAAIVAVIGVVVVAIFTVLALVSGGGSPEPSHPLSGAVSGTDLRGMAARSVLGPLLTGGEPPANIVDAVAVPVGTTRISVTNNGGGLGQYDQSAHLQVHATQESVYDFFRTEMRRAGWAVSDAGPAPNGRDLEVLGKLAGTDGWYWEMGATVSPTTFASTAAGPGTGPDITPVTIRLYQVADES